MVQYLYSNREDTLYKIINGHNTGKDIALMRGYVQGLDSYLELESVLDKYRLATEEEAKKAAQWAKAGDSSQAVITGQTSYLDPDDYK